jgi:pimeloyl-ACP methyl ester carboxylesterase
VSVIRTIDGSGAPVVCVPAFADSAESWHSLVERLSDRHTVGVVEVPGLGRAGTPPVPPTVAGVAELITGLIQKTWTAPVTLVGHSAGSAVAVRVAHQLGDRCRAVVSIEGNLTVDDAYLTGQAVDFTDADAFKNHLADQIGGWVAAGKAPASYADSVRASDAYTMWSFGRDVAAGSAGDGFGHELLRLRCPVRYLWSAATTPPVSREFLRAHSIPHRQLPVAHHWPWTVDPDAVATAVTFS